jgi:hypothetical protein
MAKLKPVLLMTIFAGVLFGINHYILSLPDYAEMHYNIFGMYGFFWVCAVVVLLVVHIVHAKSPDNTGYVFMGVTLLQMGAAYFMVRHLLGVEDEVAAFERKNFFVVFILFLAIETLITIRLLNNKQ